MNFARWMLTQLFVVSSISALGVAAEPWATCPAWLDQPIADAPAVLIADAPYQAEAGELPDPLQRGDQLTAIGDPREALLRVARLPLEDDGVTVQLRRGGENLSLTVDRRHLTRHLEGLMWSANGAARLAALGVTGDPSSLNRMPARVVAHLVAGGRAPWVARLAATWIAAETETALPPAGDEVPDPFLARCETLWRVVGADGDAQPDPWQWNLEPEFVALYAPYPGAAAPALGDLHLTDQEFLTTLREALITSPATSLAARRALAYRRVTLGDHAAGYIGQVQASLLDKEHHGGWPFRSILIYDEPKRLATLSELRAMRTAGDPDRPLVDLALVAPLLMQHADDEAFEVLHELRTDSPFLGRAAFRIMQDTVEMYEDLRPLLPRLSELDRTSPTIARPRHRGWYERMASRQPQLMHRAAFGIYDQVCGHPAGFRSDPAAVAEALAPWWDGRGKFAHEREILISRINEAAWWSTVDPRCLDPRAAAELARQLRHLRGRELPEFVLDTVAACLARSGDFPTAVRFQRLALEQAGHNRNGYDARLELYEHDQRFTETEDLDFKPLRREKIVWPSGALKAEGTREIDGGMRFGRWRTFSETGTLLEEQHWRTDQLSGWTQRFYPDGKIREEGAYTAGHQVGQWRTYAANGTLTRETWWLGTEADQQTGWTTTWHPNAHLAETGCWLDGHQEGFWQAWRTTGTPASAGCYQQGVPTGLWRTWTPDGVLTERNIAPAINTAADLF